MKLAIPPPVQLVLALLAMWGVHTLAPVLPVSFPWQAWIAAALLSSGIAMAGVAVGLFARAGTTVDPRHPEKGKAIVTGGIYRHTRNPMYLGMALVLLAMVVWTGQLLNLLVLAGFIGFMTRFQIVPEEAFLRSRYGTIFDDYTSRVRRWL